MKSKIIDEYFPVLDKGFVALKDYMGSDEDVEQAARVSYQKGTRKKTETRGLLRYCMSHRHTSIFEQCVLKFHVRAPLLVFRQWHRHRTWSYNEMSGRYSVLPNACMETTPTEWRLQSTTNKQGSEGNLNEWPEGWEFKQLGQAGWCVDSPTGLIPVSKDETPNEFLTRKEKVIQRDVRKNYEQRLNLGVAREQARKDVPVSQYSEMYATVNLHNLLHFLGLRADSHAQKEIRDYANIMAGMVKAIFPLSFEAWYDYAFKSKTLSRVDLIFFNYLIGKYSFHSIVDLRAKHEESGDQSPITLLGMTKREVEAFWSKLDVPTEQDFTLDVGKALPFEAFSLD